MIPIVKLLLSILAFSFAGIAFVSHPFRAHKPKTVELIVEDNRYGFTEASGGGRQWIFRAPGSLEILDWIGVNKGKPEPEPNQPIAFKGGWVIPKAVVNTWTTNDPERDDRVFRKVMGFPRLGVFHARGER